MQHIINIYCTHSRIITGSLVKGACIMYMGGKGPPIELEAFSCRVFPSAGVTNVCEAENLPLIVWDKECMHEMCSLGPPSPPPVCLSV